MDHDEGDCRSPNAREFLFWHLQSPIDPHPASRCRGKSHQEVLPKKIICKFKDGYHVFYSSRKSTQFKAHPVSALSCAENVVDAAGHPTPGPDRFWSEEMAVWIRLIWDAVELSVGKEAPTLGLWMSCPAATFAATCCEMEK